MNTQVRQPGVFLFNIIPVYRPGISRVFDYSRHRFGAASLPSSGQRVKQNTMFSSFEDICGDCLSDLDLLYVFANDGGELFSTLNWKDPTTFDTVLSNNPTFITDVGFQGDGVGAYLDTQWDPTNNGVNFTQNEAGAFCYVNNNVQSADMYMFGARGNATNADHGAIELSFENDTPAILYAVNNHSSLSGPETPVPTTAGFWHSQRTDSGNLYLFKDGAQVDTETPASTAVTNKDILILATSLNGTPSVFSSYQVGVFGLGTSLTGRESDLYDAWNTYFTSL